MIKIGRKRKDEQGKDEEGLSSLSSTPQVC